MNETEVLLLHLDSANHFLKNKSAEINKDYALNYYRFMRSLKKLVTAKEKNDYEELLNLEHTIKSSKIKVFGDWLLEKISEIKTKGN